MTESRRLRVFALALIGGTAMSGAAAAQETTTAPASAASVDTSEIIVTAQRRSERLRDVPISITAINQETLVKSGINNTLDIQRVTPAVQLPMFGGFLQPVVRGIGSQNSGLGDSSNVAIYIDGIYQPSQSGQLLDLPDIQQIEVLKGPQGTLYGQNAAGGAITLTSVRPSFEWTGRFSASYGNYNDVAIRGYVTGPVVDDQVAIAVAGAFQDRDGFKKNIASGKHDSGLNSKSARARLLVQVSDNAEFIVGGYYGRRSDGGIYAGQPIGPGIPNGYAFATAAGLSVPIPDSPWEFAGNVDTLTRITTYGANITGKIDTDIGTISTVSAYGNVKVLDLVDADYTAANVGFVDLAITNENYIQEINFSSEKFGRFTVSAGLFFMALKESYDSNNFSLYAFAPNFPPVTVYPTPAGPALFMIEQYAYNKKRSFAGYVEVGYDITDDLNLTVGGRYSRETQQTADNRPVARGNPGDDKILDPRGKVPFKKFTPRATLRYALNPSANVYATYAQGFKSGYVNSGDVNQTPIPDPVRPEVVKAFEVGFKGRIVDGVNLNIAAFHYDYKDVQVYVYNVGAERYLNAAGGRIKGIDGDISINLAPGLTLNAGGAYLDAKYTDFPSAVVYRPDTTTGYGYAISPYDASGKSMIRAPKWSGNAALNYSLETGAGTFGAYVAGNYNSGIKYDPAGVLRQRRYALLDTEFSFSPDALEGLRLVVWGKNLTKKAYLQSVLTSQFVQGASYADPRTYGVRAEFKF